MAEAARRTAASAPKLSPLTSTRRWLGTGRYAPLTHTYRWPGTGRYPVACRVCGDTYRRSGAPCVCKACGEVDA